MQLFLFLFLLQYIKKKKKTALQNKEVGVLGMAFRPEKFSGLSRNGPLEIFLLLLLKVAQYSFQHWFNTVPALAQYSSSTCIWMGRFNHSLSLDATIMVSKKCSIIGQHIVIIFDIIRYHSNSMTSQKTP